MKNSQILNAVILNILTPLKAFHLSLSVLTAPPVRVIAIFFSNWDTFYTRLNSYTRYGITKRLKGKEQKD